MSSQPIDLETLVRSKFNVRDSFQLQDGEMEFTVDYRPDSRDRFVELFGVLAASGYTPRLTGSADEAVLYVRKAQPLAKRRSRVPLTLALLAFGSVGAFGLLLMGIYSQYAPSVPGLTVILLYGAAVLGVLAAHELGHVIVARRRGEVGLTPYPLPGIPGITGALATLGIVSRQRGPALNRDRLYDVILAGPLFGLVLSLLIYVSGAFVSVQSAVPLQSCQLTSNGTGTLCPSVIQIGLDAVVGPFLPSVSPGYSALSPLADGATVGFILTFASLIPLASFDGGYLSGLAWGSVASRVASYVSVLLLIMLDVPDYWGLAVAALLLMNLSRSFGPQLLDEVSPTSNGRRWVYLLLLLVALLCMPVPHSFLGYSLG